MPRREFLHKHDANGPTRIGVALDFPTLVGGESFFEIIRVAGIVGAVGAAEDINVEAHGRRSMCSSFDRLRMSAGYSRVVRDLGGVVN